MFMCLYFSITTQQQIYCSSNLNAFYSQWFSSKDFEGRSYYFEENSNESSWTLPETSNISSTSDVSPSFSKADLEDSSSSLKSNKSSEKNDSK